MRRYVRWTLTWTSVAVLAAACGVNSAGQSRGEPTTTSNAGPAVSASRIDSLVVPVDQVPGGLHAAGSSSAPEADRFEPCVNGAVGDDAPFSGAIAFRSVRYSSVGNRYIVQSVAIYSSAGDAAAAFQSLGTQVDACRGAGDGSVVVDSVSADRAGWHVTGTSPVSGAAGTLGAVQAGVLENIVFRVAAGIFDDPIQIAAAIADQIAGNVRAN